MANVALVCPAGTVTDAGTVATGGFPLINATAKPAAGAARVRVTVPVAPVPPLTLAGAIFSDATADSPEIGVKMTSTQ